jgi:hypothetical protein
MLEIGHHHGCLHAVAGKRRPVNNQLHSRRVERHPSAGNRAEAGSRGSDQPLGIAQRCRNAKRQSISSGAVPRFGRGKSNFNAYSWGGFGVCDKNATKRREENASKFLNTTGFVSPCKTQFFLYITHYASEIPPNIPPQGRDWGLLAPVRPGAVRHADGMETECLAVLCTAMLRCPGAAHGRLSEYAKHSS